jgi:hypothetical protein
MRFSKVKRLFFWRVYGESEAALDSRLHLVYHPSVPQKEIPVEICPGSVSVVAVDF